MFNNLIMQTILAQNIVSDVHNWTLAFFGVLIFLLVPCSAGYPLARWLADSEMADDISEGRIVLCFSIGLCIWSLIATLGYIFKMKVEIAGYIYISFAAINLFLLRINKLRFQVYIIIYSMLLVFIVLLLGPHVSASSDTTDHMAVIRKLVTSGILDESYANVSSSAIDNMATTGYRNNTLYAWIAFIVRVMQVDIYPFWWICNASVGILLTFVVVYVSDSLFNTKQFTWVFLILLTIYLGLSSPRASGIIEVQRLLYPHSLALILYLVNLTLLLQLISSSGSLYKYCMLAMCSGGIHFVHSQWGIYWIITIGIVCIWQGIIKKFKSLLPIITHFVIVFSFILLSFLGSNVFSSDYTGNIGTYLLRYGHTSFIENIYSLYFLNPFKYFTLWIWAAIASASFILFIHTRNLTNEVIMWVNKARIISFVILCIAVVHCVPGIYSIYPAYNFVLLRSLWLVEWLGLFVIAIGIIFLYYLVSKISNFYISMKHCKRFCSYIPIFLLCSFQCLPSSILYASPSRKSVDTSHLLYGASLQTIYQSKEYQYLFNLFPENSVVLVPDIYHRKLLLASKNILIVGNQNIITESDKIFDKQLMASLNSTLSFSMCKGLCDFSPDFIMITPYYLNQFNNHFIHSANCLSEIFNNTIPDCGLTNKRYIVYKVNCSVPN